MEVKLIIYNICEEGGNADVRIICMSLKEKGETKERRTDI